MTQTGTKRNNEKRGNPYKRGSTWTFRYYLPDPQTGKNLIRTKGGFATKKQATECMAETKAMILCGEIPLSSRMTLKQYITYWFERIQSPTVKPNTKNGQRYNINNHIIPVLGHFPINQLKRHHIQEFLSFLLQEKELKVNTVHYVKVTLSKAMQEAVYSELIDKNPCDNIRLPKNEPYLPEILNIKQIHQLLGQAHKSDIELEILLAITLGLRRGEVLGLRFQDIDYEKKTAFIRQQITGVVDKGATGYTKGSSIWGIAPLKTLKGRRKIHVPDEILKLIQTREHLVKLRKLSMGDAYSDYDLICSKPNGEMENPQTLIHRFKRFLQQAKLPNVRFHDLRHSCATALIELNVPLVAISHTLGHSSIKITADIYCHITEGYQATADAFQNCFFDGGQRVEPEGTLSKIL